MKKRFALAGFAVGGCAQLALIFYGFWQAPGMPGIFEIALIIALVSFVGGVGALIGLLLGLAVELVQRLRQAERE